MQGLTSQNAYYYVFQSLVSFTFWKIFPKSLFLVFDTPQLGDDRRHKNPYQGLETTLVCFRERLNGPFSGLQHQQRSFVILLTHPKPKVAISWQNEKIIVREVEGNEAENINSV